jgi:hypothetical protein
MRSVPLKTPINAKSVRFADMDQRDKRDMALLVNRLYESRWAKRELEISYRTNVDFLEGGVKQWYRWNKEKTKRTLDPGIKEEERLIVLNMILEVAETRVSRLVRHDPTPGARPVSSDADDARRARVLTDILKYQYSEIMHYPITQGRFLLMSCASPISWIRCGWNPYCGDIIETHFDDFLAAKEKELLPQGLQAASFEQVAAYQAQAITEFVDQFGKDALQKGRVVQYGGNAYAEAVSVEQMCWYPWDAQSWDEVQMAVETLEPTAETAAEWLDMSVEEIRARTSTKNRRTPNTLRNNRRFRRNESDIKEHEDIAETVVLHRCQIRKSLNQPRGTQCFVLGGDDEAIRLGDIENTDHDFDYFPHVQHELPDQMTGTCLVSQCRSLQIDLNKAATQETMYRDRMIFPTILVPEESIVDEEDWEFSNTPGEQKKYAGPRPPTILDRPIANLDMIRTIDRNVTFLRELSSVAAIQAGKTDDAHIRSGRAIEKLDAKTNERLIQEARRFDDQQSRVWTHIALEMMRNATGSRISQILGDDNQMELLTWTAEDIRPSTWDKAGAKKAIVRVESHSQMPVSKDENRNLVLNLMKTGFFRPGEHDNEVYRLLGYGEAKRFIDRERKDRARQVYEIEQWRRGRPVEEPLMEQDHRVHIDEIEEWIRGGSEFYQVIKQFPYIAQQVDRHLRRHKVLQLKKQAELALCGQQAKAEAWIEAYGAMAQDIEAGVVPPQLMHVASQLFPLEAVLAPSGPGVQPPQMQSPPKQGKSESPKPDNRGGRVAGADGNGNGKIPMGEEQRSKAHDLSDQGVDKENVVSL